MPAGGGAPPSFNGSWAVLLPRVTPRDWLADRALPGPRVPAQVGWVVGGQSILFQPEGPEGFVG